MEPQEVIEKEDGLRLRKNVFEQKREEEEHENVEETEANEDGIVDLCSRIIESTKELSDCMPTDLPSAKRMVSSLPVVQVTVL